MVWAPITALAALIIVLIAIPWQFSECGRKATTKSRLFKTLEGGDRTITK